LSLSAKKMQTAKFLLLDHRGNSTPAIGQMVLVKNDKELNLKFNVVSSDKKNGGNKRFGKQQEFLLIPLPDSGFNMNEKGEFVIPYNIVKNRWHQDVQIVAELRDPDRGVKRKRSEFPRYDFDPIIKSEVKDDKKMLLGKYESYLEMSQFDAQREEKLLDSMIKTKQEALKSLLL